MESFNDKTSLFIYYQYPPKRKALFPEKSRRPVVMIFQYFFFRGQHFIIKKMNTSSVGTAEISRCIRGFPKTLTVNTLQEEQTAAGCPFSAPLSSRKEISCFKYLESITKSSTYQFSRFPVSGNENEKQIPLQARLKRVLVRLRRKEKNELFWQRECEVSTGT